MAGSLWQGGEVMQLFGQPLGLVILDVDGVIVDLMAGFQRNLEAAAQRLGLPLEPIRRYLAAAGAGVRHGHASLGQGIRDLWPELTQADATRFVSWFREEEGRHPYPPVEGSLEVILWLRRHQIPLALCTTNERAALRQRLEAVRIAPAWFAAASTGEDGYPQTGSTRARADLCGRAGTPRARGVCGRLVP